MLSGLKNLFRKDDPDSVAVTAVDVDMHSHVLPGLDDGAETLEKSLTMVAELQQLGYRKLIMTPHIMGDFYKNTPYNIRQKLDLLEKAVKEKNWNIELACAAEYYLDEWFIDKINGEEPLLTFGDRYVLFETSYINEPLNFQDAIFALKSSGYKPVLAPPERYSYLYGRFDELTKMYDEGMLFQLNINSLSGYYSENARRIAEKLIDHKMVDFIGTDAHHTRHLDVLAKSVQMPYYKKVLALPLRNSQL
jgi:tyrosine-protein phosphatase YwqE